MAITTVVSEQIGNGQVCRVDLNTVTIGSSVIAKLVAGPGVYLSSTGVDVGTGDVTVSISSGVNDSHFHTASNILHNIVTITNNYSPLIADNVILVNAINNDVTITLGSDASYSGYAHTVKRIDTTTHRVLITSPSLIDGNTWYISYRDSMQVRYDGSMWRVE